MLHRCPWRDEYQLELDNYYATRTVFRSAEIHSVKKNKGRRSHVKSEQDLRSLQQYSQPHSIFPPVQFVL